MTGWLPPLPYPREGGWGFIASCVLIYIVWRKYAALTGECLGAVFCHFKDKTKEEPAKVGGLGGIRRLALLKADATCAPVSNPFH